LIYHDAPATNIQPPQGLTPLDLQPFIQDTVPNRIFWASLFAATSNILAPVFGHDVHGLTVASELAAKIANDAIDACGCKYYALSRKSFDMARAKEFANKWPIAVGLADQAQKLLLREWTDIVEGPRNSIVRANWWQSRILLFSDWNMLEAEGEGSLTADVILAGSKLLPEYVQHLLKRQLKLYGKGTDLLQLVADDMVFWLKDIHVDPAVARSAKSLLRLASDNNEEAIAELICSMVAEGKVHILPEGFANVPQALIRMKRGLFVPKPLLMSFLDRKAALDLSTITVTERLANTGKLVGELSLSGTEGWLIDEEWLAARLRKLQNKSQLLRVVGGD
jgi:hypothetical protein